MSDGQWFYSDAQQQQQGPITFAQLQQMAASGQIQPTSLIWNEGMSNWTPANQVNDIFNSAPSPGAPAPAAPNPYATPTSAPSYVATSGGSYPIPAVKRCNFPLYLGLFILGIILYLAGAALLFSAATDQVVQEDFQRIANGERSTMTTRTDEIPVGAIAVMGLGGVTLLIAMILSFIYLYRAWFILQPGGAQTTPGKAVGFCFFPFFNLYWIFVAYHGWSKDWNRIRASHSNLAHLPGVAEGLFLAGPICMLASIIPLIGLLAALAYPIIFMIMVAQMCKVVNAMADASRVS